MTTLINPQEPISNLAIGSIVEVDGTHIIAEIASTITQLTCIYEGVIYPIGQFGSIIKIHFGTKIIYAYVGRLRMKYEHEIGDARKHNPTENNRIIEADLFGEGTWAYENDQKAWALTFERGVTTFPLPQQKIYLTPRSELTHIFGKKADAFISIGEHVGSGGAHCYADMNELLGKHTAILGSTGSGKSGTVATVLHAIIEHGKNKEYDKWNPKIIILDPHNEYETTFADKYVKLCTDEDNFKLPYWLLNFDETLDLLIGSTKHSATVQVSILKTAILLAKQEITKGENITIDSPVPYSLNTLIDHITSDMNGNETTKSKQASCQTILEKIDVLVHDSRYAFMMRHVEDKSDNFTDIIKQFWNNTDNVCIIDLSGVPNEIAGITSSVIARTLFSLKIWQTKEERQNSPVLIVCEEAHRYVPNRGESQYAASQDAIRRIAKEGRKYGIGLLLVSQRPSEIDSGVLSQCNSWLVMRVTNDTDRSHVQVILPDSMAGLTKMLSGLRRREAIFIGQAATLPSRILMHDLTQSGKQLPRSQDIDFNQGWKNDILTDEYIKEIGARWRTQTRKGQKK